VKVAEVAGYGGARAGNAAALVDPGGLLEAVGAALGHELEEAGGALGRDGAGVEAALDSGEPKEGLGEAGLAERAFDDLAVGAGAAVGSIARVLVW
jgi:hypothetical protein